MIKKRVAELVDIERDINPYDVIALYAGVGSGKNTFIEGYHSKTENVIGLAENHRVLFITSRRAKVDETEKRDNENGNNFIRYIIETDSWNYDERRNKSVICTNAHVAKRIKETFKLGDESTYFWNNFDYIVIDEYHSLVTDTTFADSSFYLTALLNFVCNQTIKPKIILMSATPDSVSFITKKIEAHKLDFRNQSISLKPKRFQTLPKKYINKYLFKKDDSNSKTVYFVTKLSHINSILKDAPKEFQDKTAVIVSDTEHNKMLKDNYPAIYNNSKATIESLRLNETIPENIEIVITNSKLKEGINIKTPVDYLFIESHILSDIQQMCGRIRNPETLKCTYLITDAEQFQPLIKNIERDYQFKYGLQAVNKFLEENTSDCDKRQQTIDYIESTTKYIRFNPFTNKFVKNILYKECLEYISSALKIYDDNMDLFEICQDFDDADYVDYFCSNGAKIRKHIPPDKIMDIDKAVIESLKNKKNIDILNCTFSSEDTDLLLKHINEIINLYEPNCTPYKSLGFALKFIKCKKIDSSYSHKKGIKPTFTIVKDEEKT